MPRPLKHSHEKVITAAMQVFWNKGYSATSMADLKTATGLNPGSLYSSYQSKEHLFLVTLEFYCERSIDNLEKTLTQSTDYIKNIHQFFDNFEENYLQANYSNKGCFFVNTLIEMSPQNDNAKELLNSYKNRYQKIFSVTLDKAQQSKQISESVDIELMAQQIMLTIWGLRVMHRSGLMENTSKIVTQQLKDIFKI